MKKVISSIVVVLFSGLILFAQADKIVPTFEEVLSLRSPGTPIISPDGKDILFTVSQVDWKNNRFDSEIWISKNGEEPFQLTNNPESSSSNPSWSPDGRWIAFTSSRGNKNQLFVMRSIGGEAFAVTNVKQGVGSFDWSPDGKKIAISVQTKDEKTEKAIEEKYGSFAIEDAEYSMTRLWVVEFNPKNLDTYPIPGSDSLNRLPDPVKLIDSVNYTVGGFLWSPDSRMIAFSHQPDPLINSFFNSDISILYLESNKIVPLVNNPSTDAIIEWSPDSKSVLYRSSIDDFESNYYLNSRYFRIDINGSNGKELATDFDENLSGIVWTEKGIYATAYRKTARNLFLLDPKKGSVKEVLSTPARINGFTISNKGDRIAFSGADDLTLNEIYITEVKDGSIKRITDFTSQIAEWKYSNSEVISWKSKDGTIIEGVLHKPLDYDPNKRYPLLVNIHGGPTGISTPGPVPSYVYPILQWLDKGALVLMPNYRGSAGYGEEFRKLNVKNLGIGDAWDVMSGIEYLDSKGIIDTDKLGSMGWSQGGYISAFLTTNTNVFKAISVGAGISNWMTYYVNTDIHPFTRQYLKATPWSNEEIYRSTSPMTNINNASTPTLIQHGEFDQRVPIPNAYELYQGLQDIGVDTRLIVYKGFGHGITKPKERLAAVWHNWQWFGKYIWGEEIEIPKE